jgi:hypothetical protein
MLFNKRGNLSDVASNFTSIKGLALDARKIADSSCFTPVQFNRQTSTAMQTPVMIPNPDLDAWIIMIVVSKKR